MVDRIEYFLNFPDATTALQAAIALGFTGEDATELPKDGWLAGRTDGQLYYYCIDVCFGDGVIYAPTGATTTDAEGNAVPVMAAVPGFHVNGLWFGPEDQCPDFGAARVYPTTPAVRFG